MKYELIPVMAVFHDTIKRDPQAAALIRFLSVLLPPALHLRYGMKYDSNTYTKLITKEIYNDLLENFLLTLKDMKCVHVNSLVNLLKRRKELKTDPDIYSKLASVLMQNKPHIQKALPNVYRDVNRMVALYNAKELSPTSLKAIKEIVSQIDSKTLRRSLRTIEGFGIGASVEAYNSALTEYHDFVRQTFKQKSKKQIVLPTNEQLNALKEKDLAKFNMHKALSANVKKLSKSLLEDAWIDRGFSKLVDVVEVHDLLSELNIADPIDPGFKGKIGLVPTGNVLFSYWTIYDKELANVPGHDVKMNPAYTKEDNTYYCTGFPQFSGGERKHFYTKDFSTAKLQDKHDNVNLITPEMLQAARAEYTATYKQIINDDTLTSTTLAALIVAVIDDTAGRIGGSGSSEENGVYGISILLAKHCKILKNSVKLSYIGKKKVQQEHVITDPNICAALKYLKSTRKPAEYLFSKDGETPISAGFVNRYIHNTLKLPISAHGFRKLHANRIFNEMIEANKKQIKKNPLDVFEKAVNAVAAKLGHEPINSIKSYIDPVLIRNFFDNAKVQPPKTVQNVLDNMFSKQQTPDYDE